MENGPFISDCPIKTSIQFGDFPASQVWWHQRLIPHEYPAINHYKVPLNHHLPSGINDAYHLWWPESKRQILVPHMLSSCFRNRYLLLPTIEYHKRLPNSFPIKKIEFTGLNLKIDYSQELIEVFENGWISGYILDKCIPSFYIRNPCVRFSFLEFMSHPSVFCPHPLA